VFRAIKAATPGSYTFILPATKEVPRMLQHPGKKTVGVRIPRHVVTRALLAELGEPLVSSTLLLPGQDEPMTRGRQIAEQIGHDVDAVVQQAAAKSLFGLWRPRPRLHNAMRPASDRDRLTGPSGAPHRGHPSRLFPKRHARGARNRSHSSSGASEDSWAVQRRRSGLSADSAQTASTLRDHVVSCAIGQPCSVQTAMLEPIS
jgi:hypothetical protein